MQQIWAGILLSFMGLLALVIGVVILKRKRYFSYSKKGQFIGTVSGKKAKSHGISSVIMGLVFLGLGVAILLWGG